MYSKTKHKDIKHFCVSCLQNFTTKEMLNKHKEQCLLINETQAVKYETGIIKFKSFEKQIPISFKIYADTECLLKKMTLKKVNTQSYIKNTHLILQVLNQFVLITDLPYQLKYLQVIMALIILLNGFLHNKKELIK